MNTHSKCWHLGIDQGNFLKNPVFVHALVSVFQLKRRGKRRGGEGGREGSESVEKTQHRKIREMRADRNRRVRGQ